MRNFLIGLFMLVATQLSAEVTYDGNADTLTISGPTSTEQVTKAINFLVSEPVKYVFMYGPGGEFLPSLSLGKVIKEKGVTVIIPKERYCISACGFSALAATELKIDGTMMLHKPFVRGAPFVETLEGISTYMGNGYLKMAYYLEDLGYPRSLAMTLMQATTTCKYIEYSGIVVVARKDLKNWKINDKCDMMNFLR